MTLNQKIDDEYTVVVIGAGNGGLVAAARLALSGVKVLLIEQHNLPGGFATSFVRGRFEFETSLHELEGYGTIEDPGSIRVLFDKKLKIDAKFIEVPEAYRVITKDIDAIMPFGKEEFLDAIEKEVPGSRESVKKFFKLGEEIHKAFRYVGKTQGKPDQTELLKEHQ